MDELQLRVSVRKVKILADAIERDLAARNSSQDDTELEELLNWLRYRLSLFASRRAPERAT